MDDLHTSLEDFHAMGVRCPFCPHCGMLPMLLMPGLRHCWCPNDSCDVLMWDPWATAKQNLEDQHAATETELFGE